VIQAINEFFDKLPKKTPFAVADIPLLYETGRQKQFESVIVVACPKEMQLERMLSRDRLSKEDAERRLAAQLPIGQKVEKADYVIRTEGGFDKTDEQIQAVLEKLRSKD
jgi:dephospho-CoA kinase